MPTGQGVDVLGKRTMGAAGVRALEATHLNGENDPLLKSPRGPITIDPATRDVVQTVYMRRVEKVGSQLVNVEFDKIENVKDPVKARTTK